MKYQQLNIMQWVLLTAIVTVIQPVNLTIAQSNNYETDMQAFIDHIDRNYPFITLKNIESDWTTAKTDLIKKAQTCETDEQFLLILYDTFCILHDGHLSIREARIKLPEIPPQYYPGLSFLPATNNRIVIMYAPEPLADTLKTGTIVTQIDDTDARQYLEAKSDMAWQKGGFFSSPQRARLFEYRIAFRGEQGEKHTLTYEDENGMEKAVSVENNIIASGWPHTYNLPPALKRVGRSFLYTKLYDNVGYMYLRRVDDSIPTGIDEASKTYPDVDGWIVDLRGNGGGGYDAALIDRIERLTQLVVVIIDAGCASAGETLARDFRRCANAFIIGTKTAGSSSSKSSWTFPSGIATLTIPVRSRWRSDGQPIEFNGIDPDLVVNAVPEELKSGKNSAILRAHQYILNKLKPAESQTNTDDNQPSIPGEITDNN